MMKFPAHRQQGTTSTVGCSISSDSAFDLYYLCMAGGEVRKLPETAWIHMALRQVRRRVDRMILLSMVLYGVMCAVQDRMRVGLKMVSGSTFEVHKLLTTIVFGSKAH